MPSPPTITLSAFCPPATDAERLEHGKRVLTQASGLTSIASGVESAFEQFSSAHHLFFRGGRQRQLPASGATARARALLNRAVAQGLIRPTTGERHFPSANSDELSGALCASLDRLVRHLVLSRQNAHVQLLWDAACLRDTLNRRTRSLDIIQNLRRRWDRNYTGLFFVAQGFLVVSGQEQSLPQFFSAAILRSPKPRARRLVRPPSSHDTLSDDTPDLAERAVAQSFPTPEPPSASKAPAPPEAPAAIESPPRTTAANDDDGDESGAAGDKAGSNLSHQTVVARKRTGTR